MTGNLESSVLIAFLAGAFLALILTVLFYQSRMEKLRQEHGLQKKKSVNQSRSTLKGQIAEQMAPLLPGFNYQASDARFLGDPVDYVVFHGRSTFGSEEETDNGFEIVFVEIKQGKSRPTAIQNAIGKAVAEGRVRFEVSYIAEDGSIQTDRWPSA